MMTRKIETYVKLLRKKNYLFFFCNSPKYNFISNEKYALIEFRHIKISNEKNMMVFELL